MTFPVPAQERLLPHLSKEQMYVPLRLQQQREVVDTANEVIDTQG
jgi:hypothetical protein